MTLPGLVRCGSNFRNKIEFTMTGHCLWAPVGSAASYIVLIPMSAREPLNKSESSAIRLSLSLSPPGFPKAHQSPRRLVQRFPRLSSSLVRSIKVVAINTVTAPLFQQDRPQPVHYVRAMESGPPFHAIRQSILICGDATRAMALLPSQSVQSEGFLIGKPEFWIRGLQGRSSCLG